MEETKKKNSSLFVKMISSKKFRDIILTVLLFFSLFSMMLFDQHNVIRRRFFAWLDTSNIVKRIMEWLNLHFFNVQKDAWYIFACLFTVAAVFVFGTIFRPKITAKILSKKERTPEQLKKDRRVITVLYYVALFVISAIIIGIYYVCGAFNHVDGSQELGAIFFNLFLSILYFMAFLVLFIIAILIVVFIVKMICFLVAYIVNSTKAFSNRLDFYRYADNETVVKDMDGVQHVNIEEELMKRKKELQLSIDNNNGSGSGSGMGSGSFTIENSKPKLLASKEMFPALTSIDMYYADNAETTVSADVTLEEFILRFQSYAINHHQIYYGLPMLRAFIAGMSVSRLIVLEGLSGTGKSMLPRMFSEFTHSKKYFAPVQATWRDKTDLLGFYSEFTKSFKTTDFLYNLYSASYTDKVNMMVLDEMNISRIEYYFADFLSILEYPSEDWKVKVYEPDIDQELPTKLEGGYVTVPTNTWFIGTANTDDSTFTITDKVYDRAIILDFKEKISPISSTYNSDPLDISSERLTELFEQAQKDEAKCLNEQETERFLKLCDHMRDAFDIRFGNRIMVQIQGFVPVYVALGGTKEAALDFIFATKILRKLQGVYEDYVKDELAALLKILHETYGKGTFKYSEKVIAKILKRLV